MTAEKKTGLGDSLLLRRTDPKADLAGNSSDAQTSETPRGSTARGRKTKQPKPLRDRCTIYLEQEVNQRLHLAARIEDRERSEIVSQILRAHLPKYRIETEE